MVARAKILFIAITLFCIVITNMNMSVNQFKLDIQKMTKSAFEECEKENKGEKNKSDEFTHDFFTYPFFSNTVSNYPYKHKEYNFQLSIRLYKPPITSLS